jgi:S-adenosylmethionine hydrolase
MKYFYLALFLFIVSCSKPRPAAVVFQTDFGLKDGAVSAMKGVTQQVDANIPLFDLTHEIPAYNIWEAGYRLNQTAMYWPAGTVFVSVVDPGVGTDRKPVVLKTSSGHYIVSPDNGTLTLIAESLGIAGVREIDTVHNRRQGSEGSHTFHGRDIFAYTAARLASGKISFEEVGKELKNEVVVIPYQKAAMEDDSIKGNIPVLDIQYGNVWTNISDSMIKKAGINYGDSLNVVISNNAHPLFSGRIPFVRTFGDVPDKHLLGYMNSLGNFSLAVNMGSFADSFKIASGAEWSLILKK